MSTEGTSITARRMTSSSRLHFAHYQWYHNIPLDLVIKGLRVSASSVSGGLVGFAGDVGISQNNLGGGGGGGVPFIPQIE